MIRKNGRLACVPNPDRSDRYSALNMETGVYVPGFINRPFEQILCKVNTEGGEVAGWKQRATDAGWSPPPGEVAPGVEVETVTQEKEDTNDEQFERNGQQDDAERTTEASGDATSGVLGDSDL